MLVLSRKIGESIVIGPGIIVTVVRVDGDAVRVGIQAPKDVPIHRLEIYEEIQGNNRQALTHMRQPVPRLPSKRNSKRDVEQSPASVPA